MLRTLYPKYPLSFFCFLLSINNFNQTSENKIQLESVKEQLEKIKSIKKIDINYV